MNSQTLACRARPLTYICERSKNFRRKYFDQKKDCNFLKWRRFFPIKVSPVIETDSEENKIVQSEKNSTGFFDQFFPLLKKIQFPQLVLSAINSPNVTFAPATRQDSNPCPQICSF